MQTHSLFKNNFKILKFVSVSGQRSTPRVSIPAYVSLIKQISLCSEEECCRAKDNSASVLHLGTPHLPQPQTRNTCWLNIGLNHQVSHDSYLKHRNRYSLELQRRQKNSAQIASISH